MEILQLLCVCLKSLFSHTRWHCYSLFKTGMCGETLRFRALGFTLVKKKIQKTKQQKNNKKPHKNKQDLFFFFLF